MLTVTRKIMISAPKESVRLYLRDLKNMQDYEQKVAQVVDVSARGSNSKYAVMPIMMKRRLVMSVLKTLQSKFA